MGGGLAAIGMYLIAGVFMVAFLGEVAGRPICRRLFGRPGVATVSSAAIAVLGIAAIVPWRLGLGGVVAVLLNWSWGWALGGMLTDEGRRTDGRAR